jgi:formiminoglutamase
MTLLLAQRSYLRHESPPFEPDKTRIARLRAVLQDAMTRIVDWTAMTGPGASGKPPSAVDQAAIEEPVSVTETEVAEAQPQTAEAPAEVSALEPARAEILHIDPATLTQVSRSETGKAADGPVRPLLVAE